MAALDEYTQGQGSLHLDQQIMWEWRNLLQPHKDHVAYPLCSPGIGQCVIDLPAAEHNTPDLVWRQQEGLSCLGVFGQMPGVV